MNIFYTALTHALCASIFVVIAFTPGRVMSASVADLLISEVMANPQAVSDSDGEWFELFNPADVAIDLNGITLSDLGSNSHVISYGGSLLINPGEYFVLARSGDVNINGGLDADYVYGNDFSLTNSEDEIILTDNSGNSLQLLYGTGFVSAGISSELSRADMQTDSFDLASELYGAGDLGTPGYGQYYLGTTTSPVPLPGAALLMTSGLLGLTGLARRRSA